MLIDIPTSCCIEHIPPSVVDSDAVPLVDVSIKEPWSLIMM